MVGILPCQYFQLRAHAAMKPLDSKPPALDGVKLAIRVCSIRPPCLRIQFQMSEPLIRALRL